jgi:hypothetical protein
MYKSSNPNDIFKLQFLSLNEETIHEIYDDYFGEDLIDELIYVRKLIVARADFKVEIDFYSSDNKGT